MTLRDDKNKKGVQDLPCRKPEITHLFSRQHDSIC